MKQLSVQTDKPIVDLLDFQTIQQLSFRFLPQEKILRSRGDEPRGGDEIKSSRRVKLERLN